MIRDRAVEFLLELRYSTLITQKPPDRERVVMRKSVLSMLMLATACSHRPATRATPQAKWLATWQASPQLVEPRNMPPAPGLTGNTLRQVIHVSLGGTRWRFRLSNEFGDAPFVIASVHVARSRGRDTIDAATDATLSFGGSRGITIPAGSAVTSDAVGIECPAFCDLTLSMHITSAPRGVTGHPGSRTTSFIATGDHVVETASRVQSRPSTGTC